MSDYSTRQAAKQLGLGLATLSRYISNGKVPPPKSVTGGGMTIHLWADEDIERVRNLLPKIKNGRKTRYAKKHSAVSTQSTARRDLRQSVKAKNKKQKKQRQTKKK